MKDLDYSIGEKAHPLNKKNLEWYCNKLLEYAHDGMSLDYFLHDFMIRKSEWDKYVKKHKKLQVALDDAAARAKGKAFSYVYNKMKVESNSLITPTIMKAYAEQMLGWNKNKDDGLEDQPQPIININLGKPGKGPVPTGAKKTKGGNGEDNQPLIVQATGQSGGNGKGNGRN